MIVLGVARGLQYLHNLLPGIIHGDMKADNVLINRRGHPCLCDFGLSRVLIENSLWNTTATYANGTMRWMAPELLDGSQPRATTESDIYAYGMTCYEIMTGKVPHYGCKTDALAMRAILFEKKLPTRDAKCIPDFIWKFMTECWSGKPEMRPMLPQILESLQPHVCKENSSLCIYRDCAPMLP